MAAEFRGVAAVDQRGGQAARPQLIRALNEQLLLGQIRQLGPCSRAELARLSGLSKPTVSLALANVERSGLIRIAGQRTGVPGRSARLYRDQARTPGSCSGLDIGHHYLRGALADLTGEIRAKHSARTRASSVRGRIAELIRLADTLCADAGIARDAITQTVIGSPGVYDPRRGAMALTGGLSGLSRPAVLAGLRDAFGDGPGRRERRGRRRAGRAGARARPATSRASRSCGSAPASAWAWSWTAGCTAGRTGWPARSPTCRSRRAQGADEQDARRRGTLEAAGSAPAVVRAARRAGMRGPVSARSVFAAAAKGDERAVAVVAAEARLVAKAISAVVTVVDPELVVLGGGIGQAPGFAAAVTAELRVLSPVLPEVRVSALGTDAVVDGCLASGADLAWARLVRLTAHAG